MFIVYCFKKFKPILNPLVKKKKPLTENKVKPQVKRKFVEIENKDEKTGYRRRSLRVKGIVSNFSLHF